MRQGVGGISVGLALAALSAVLAPAAPAAAGLRQCPHNKLCIWDDPFFEGRFYAFDVAEPDLGEGGLSGTVSVVNTTWSPWCLYAGPIFTGRRYEVSGFAVEPQLPPFRSFRVGACRR
ncbi:peptidase inhibitor family I36 protein [Salinactinospora qingdaonensis]|uniref:Peptidase inhibitor family I36 n=1 Tax=Salinactinospora qingdaonensis TaxID=702744 RepID=A0ABP7FBR2_9ACTN